MRESRKSAATHGLQLLSGTIGSLNQQPADESVSAISKTGAIVSFGRQKPYPINEIMSNPGNDYPGMDEHDLQMLSDSLMKVGCLNAIILRKPRPSDNAPSHVSAVLVCGENRWRAAHLAGLSTLPSRMIESDHLDETLEDEIMSAENDLRRGGGTKAEAKREWILKHFGDMIRNTSHGGARRSKTSGNISLLIEQKSKGKIPKGTAQRIVAELSKEIKPKPSKPNRRKQSGIKHSLKPLPEALANVLKKYPHVSGTDLTSAWKEAKKMARSNH